MSSPSPFRSEAARSRYLKAYEEWGADWPVPSEQRFVPTAYGSTFVRGSGPADAPPLVLLPGAGATSLMWAANVAALSAHHRVWAVDSIADHGRSEPSRPVRTARDFVTWLDELTAALAPGGRFGLAGVSYGAWIAAQYALARPERLSALALIAPAGTVMPLGLGFVLRAVSCALPSRFFTRRFMTWLAHDLSLGDARSQSLLERRIEEGYLAIRSFKARRLVEPSLLSDEQLRALPSPTLFIVGENERIFPASAAVERLRRVAPGIEIELVPGAGHDVTLVRAEHVSSRLLDLFSEGIRPRGTPGGARHRRGHREACQGDHTMKAYELQSTTGIEGWVQVEKPQPQPGPGQALVRIRAVSLNYRDLIIANGTYPSAKTPLIPVSDGAGEVVAVGAGVTRVKPGDRVAPTFFQVWTEGPSTPEKVRNALGGSVPGVLAEYVALDAEGLVLLPDWLSFEEGATLPCAAVTVWNALVPQGGLKAGQTVLAQGTGGVSIFALQLARILGARVILTSSHDDKLERGKRLGAEGLINYKKSPNWEEQVLALTGGAGVDHVLEVGGAGTLPHSVRATKKGGHIALIGLLSGAMAKADSVDTGDKALRIVPTYVGSRVMFEDMLRAMSREKTKPVIDRVFPFAEAREALRYMESGGHFGKIVISV